MGRALKQMEHVIEGCICPGKKCAACKEIKCYGAFTVSRDRKSGIKSPCKICGNAKNRIWRDANLEYSKERVRSYHQTHKEQDSTRNKRWREKNREYDSTRKRAWETKNREKYLAWRNRRHLERNGGIRRRRSKLTPEERKVSTREYNKKYYWQNRDRMNNRVRTWQQSNLSRNAIKESNRRARKKSIQGKHTVQQIQEQLKRQHYCCYYAACGFAKFKKIKGKYVYHVEHTFPVSRVVGTDIPANSISYLVLACPHCNASKKDKFPWEWPEGGRLL